MNTPWLLVYGLMSDLTCLEFIRSLKSNYLILFDPQLLWIPQRCFWCLCSLIVNDLSNRRPSLLSLFDCWHDFFFFLSFLSLYLFCSHISRTSSPLLFLTFTPPLHDFLPPFFSFMFLFCVTVSHFFLLLTFPHLCTVSCPSTRPRSLLPALLVPLLLPPPM